MQRTLLWTALFGAALAYSSGCGNSNGSSGTGGSGGTTTTTTTKTSTGGVMAVGGGSGSGAMGGAGGMTTTTSMGTTGGTGGTGGSGGSGGSGGGMTTTSTTADLLNGCDPATAEDHTADATTTVNQSGLAFAPQCIRIKAGSSVKFVDNFVSHPLVGGTVANGAKMPDANSPIKMTNSGTEATFMFPDVGKYGYYCDIHALSGMVGAVFVE